MTLESQLNALGVKVKRVTTLSPEDKNSTCYLDTVMMQYENIE